MLGIDAGDLELLERRIADGSLRHGASMLNEGSRRIAATVAVPLPERGRSINLAR